MSERVKSATDAIRIGKEAASEAGLMFYTVSGARKKDGTWIVEVVSPIGLFEAVIASTSGEVTEWKLAQTALRK